MKKIILRDEKRRIAYDTKCFLIDSFSNLVHIENEKPRASKEIKDKKLINLFLSVYPTDWKHNILGKGILPGVYVDHAEPSYNAELFNQLYKKYKISNISS